MQNAWDQFLYAHDMIGRIKVFVSGPQRVDEYEICVGGESDCFRIPCVLCRRYHGRAAVTYTPLLFFFKDAYKSVDGLTDLARGIQ